VNRLLTSLSLLALTLTAGCHAQVPPASPGYNVNLSWSAPAANGNWAGCTATAPCVYAVYRCTGTAAACVTFSSTGWTEITNASTRPSGLTYTDTTATGLTVNYALETVQGSSNSGPSNTYNVAVPGIPLAPTLASPSDAAAHLELPRAHPLVHQGCFDCFVSAIPTPILTATLSVTSLDKALPMLAKAPPSPGSLVVSTVVSSRRIGLQVQ
jgi:hypothetical protein